MSIGERIKIVRGNMRQDAFAEKVGVHVNTIGRWERGQRTPDIDDLNKILAVFSDINPSWLLSGEGSVYKQLGGLPRIHESEYTKRESSIPTATEIMARGMAREIEVRKKALKSYSKIMDELDLEVGRIVRLLNDLNYDNVFKLTEIVEEMLNSQEQEEVADSSNKNGSE